jgi:hypothetical protein
MKRWDGPPYPVNRHPSETFVLYGGGEKVSLSSVLEFQSYLQERSPCCNSGAGSSSLWCLFIPAPLHITHTLPVIMASGKKVLIVMTSHGLLKNTGKPTGVFLSEVRFRNLRILSFLVGRAPLQRADICWLLSGLCHHQGREASGRADVGSDDPKQHDEGTAIFLQRSVFFRSHSSR